MSAFEAGQAQFVSRQAFGIGRFEFDVESSVKPAGAAHIEFAFGFGIEVEQDVALKQPAFQSESAGHAGFLVGGNQGFHRAVFQGGGLQDRQRGSYAHPVVSAQRGTVGPYPFAVYVGFDRVGQEVVLLVGILLRNHVHVGLQDYPFAVLHARCGRFAHDYIAHLVHLDFDIALLGEFNQESPHLFFMLGRTGLLGHRIEVGPNVFRFERGNVFVHDIDFFID